MTDKVALATAPASPVLSPEAQTAPAKKGAASPKTKKPRVKPGHPRTAEMVNAAIQNLKERGGSSLQAIKKYIVATYMVDAEKQAPFIKKYLKTAVASGILTQTKGKGASGSFKMSAAKPDAPKVKAKTAATKPASPKKKVSPVVPVKKPRAPKKASASKKAGGPAAEKAAKTPKSPVVKSPKAKSPSKAKKAAKAPTSKPKAPKPKKAPAAAAATAASPKAAKPAPKKAAASKKK